MTSTPHLRLAQTLHLPEEQELFDLMEAVDPEPRLALGDQQVEASKSAWREASHES